MAFGTQQSGGDKNLYPSGGDVVDKAPVTRNPPGSSGLGLQRGDIEATALCGSVMAMASSSGRDDAEVLREQLRGIMRKR
jgi:hypothetical protein